MSYAPNGSVLTANDSVNGNWGYGYDDFNRLTGASKNSGQQTYNYVYDRYGNRWQQNAPQGGNQHLLTFNLSNNNRMDGYSYDASGNLLNDGSSAFTYDAEGRIHTAIRSGVTTTYVYDAAGRRVRKTVGSVSTDYLYNLAGGAIAEINGSGTWTRGEVFVGGKHLATYAGGASGTTYFNHSDWLGTERVRSDMNGAACETITSLLFGDGMATSGACGDESTRHFTGKQHDDESNLDDFGGRYYSSQFGRFVSADWSEIPAPVPYADLTNPQSLNLYSLVHGNPATFADLDGHMAPGQLGFSGGLGITARMRGGNASAYGCVSAGCNVYVWALTTHNADGTTTTEFFNSEFEARAALANTQAQAQQNHPQCFAQLKYREVNDKIAKTFRRNHAFWYVQGSDGKQYIISGGPNPPDGSNRMLNVWPPDSNINGVNNVSAGTSWNSGLSEANCSGVDAMKAAAVAWPQDTIAYNPVAGPNSDTAAHYLGTQAGFDPPAPPGMTGWNTPLPLVQHNMPLPVVRH